MRWRLTNAGLELQRKGLDPYIPRTGGKPKSATLCWQSYQFALTGASERWGVDIRTLIAMICIEAVRRDGLYFDERSERYEERIDDYSTGLMQTLVKNNANASERRTRYLGREVTRADLRSPDVSIAYGAMYLSHLGISHGTDDPILLAAGYNAGGMYEDDDSLWNLRTYGEKRLDHFAAWFNDAHEVLRTYGDGRIDRFVAWHNDALAVMGES